MQERSAGDNLTRRKQLAGGTNYSNDGHGGHGRRKGGWDGVTSAELAVPMTIERYTELVAEFDSATKIMLQWISDVNKGSQTNLTKVLEIVSQAECSVSNISDSYPKEDIPSDLTRGLVEIERLKLSLPNLPEILSSVWEILMKLEQNPVFYVESGVEDQHEFKIKSFEELFPSAKPFRTKLDDDFNFDKIDFSELQLPIFVIDNCKKSLLILFEDLRNFIKTFKGGGVMKSYTAMKENQTVLRKELKKVKRRYSDLLAELSQTKSKLRMIEKTSVKPVQSNQFRADSNVSKIKQTGSFTVEVGETTDVVENLLSPTRGDKRRSRTTTGGYSDDDSDVSDYSLLGKEEVKPTLASVSVQTDTKPDTLRTDSRAGSRTGTRQDLQSGAKAIQPETHSPTPDMTSVNSNRTTSNDKNQQLGNKLKQPPTGASPGNSTSNWIEVSQPQPPLTEEERESLCSIPRPESVKELLSYLFENQPNVKKTATKKDGRNYVTDDKSASESLKVRWAAVKQKRRVKRTNSTLLKQKGNRTNDAIVKNELNGSATFTETDLLLHLMKTAYASSQEEVTNKTVTTPDEVVENTSVNDNDDDSITDSQKRKLTLFGRLPYQLRLGVYPMLDTKFYDKPSAYQFGSTTINELQQFENFITSPPWAITNCYSNDVCSHVVLSVHDAYRHVLTDPSRFLTFFQKLGTVIDKSFHIGEPGWPCKVITRKGSEIVINLGKDTNQLNKCIQQLATLSIRIRNTYSDEPIYLTASIGLSIGSVFQLSDQCLGNEILIASDAWKRLSEATKKLFNHKERALTLKDGRTNITVLSCVVNELSDDGILESDYYCPPQEKEGTETAAGKKIIEIKSTSLGAIISSRRQWIENTITEMKRIDSDRCIKFQGTEEEQALEAAGMAVAVIDLNGSSAAWGNHLHYSLSKDKSRREYADTFIESIKEFRDVLRNSLMSIEGWEVFSGGDCFILAFRKARQALKWSLSMTTKTQPWPAAIFSETPNFSDGGNVCISRIGLALGEARLVSTTVPGSHVVCAAALCGLCDVGGIYMTQSMSNQAKVAKYKTIDQGTHRIESLKLDLDAYSIQIGGASCPPSKLKVAAAALASVKIEKNVIAKHGQKTNDILKLHRRVRLFVILFQRAFAKEHENPISDEQLLCLWVKSMAQQGIDFSDIVAANPHVRAKDVGKLRHICDEASRFVIDDDTREERAFQEQQYSMLCKSTLGYLSRAIKQCVTMKRRGIKTTTGVGQLFAKTARNFLSEKDETTQATNVLKALQGLVKSAPQQDTNLSELGSKSEDINPEKVVDLLGKSLWEKLRFAKKAPAPVQASSAIRNLFSPQGKKAPSANSQDEDAVNGAPTVEEPAPALPVAAKMFANRTLVPMKTQVPTNDILESQAQPASISNLTRIASRRKADQPASPKSVAVNGATRLTELLSKLRANASQQREEDPLKRSSRMKDTKSAFMRVLVKSRGDGLRQDQEGTQSTPSELPPTKGWDLVDLPAGSNATKQLEDAMNMKLQGEQHPKLSERQPAADVSNAATNVIQKPHHQQLHNVATEETGPADDKKSPAGDELMTFSAETELPPIGPAIDQAAPTLAGFGAENSRRKSRAFNAKKFNLALDDTANSSSVHQRSQKMMKRLESKQGPQLSALPKQPSKQVANGIPSSGKLPTLNRQETPEITALPRNSFGSPKTAVAKKTPIKAKAFGNDVQLPQLNQHMRPRARW